MLIGGVEKLSLLDYPDRISAIVFTEGCNFRCHFCYNPMLVLPNAGGAENKLKDRLISEDDLLAFLTSRVGKLDGVVITGGEPTINPDLPEFITKIKNLGYLIKLDTNGTNPDMLNYLINKKLLNYIAMDIKAPLAKYEEVVNVRVDLNKIRESVKIIKGAKLSYEFRTTVVPNFLKLIDIGTMAKELVGAKKWYLQKFESNKSLIDSKLENSISYTDQELEAMAELGRAIMSYCYYRAYV